MGSLSVVVVDPGLQVCIPLLGVSPVICVGPLALPHLWMTVLQIDRTPCWRSSSGHFSSLEGLSQAFECINSSEYIASTSSSE